MNIRLLIVLGIVSMNCFGFSPKEYSKKVQSVVSRHAIVYNNVLVSTASQVAVDAPLLGNGYAAIALSENPEKKIQGGAQ